MALTRRGKVVTTLVGAAVFLSAGVGALALSGHAPAPIQRVIDTVTGRKEPPPTCPLTGEPAPGGVLPARAALAVKVENTDDAYPLAGLQKADIVYEELVEGGITRFMAVYQCTSSPRVGPVRSARTTDPRILLQFGPRSMISYSGGQPKVIADIRGSTLISYDETTGGEAFTRDDARVMPHNLFIDTAKLWTRAGAKSTSAGSPSAVFAYDAKVPTPAKRISSVRLPFSSSNIATWTWEASRDSWQRLLHGSPMTLESGQAITATNVIIQQVVVEAGNLVDVLGYASPEITMTGTGKAWVLRDGRMIRGRWIRSALGDVTRFETKDGQVIALSPGNTWVELLPTGPAPDFEK